MAFAMARRSFNVGRSSGAFRVHALTIASSGSTCHVSGAFAHHAFDAVADVVHVRLGGPACIQPFQRYLGRAPLFPSGPRGHRPVEGCRRGRRECSRRVDRGGRYRESGEFREHLLYVVASACTE